MRVPSHFARPTPPLLLLVRLARTSATHHRLDLVRADGTQQSVQLETRSCLWHDLVHFAVESEASLGEGLFGRLARGADYASLATDRLGETDTLVMLQIERLVGAVQGAWRTGLEPAPFVARYQAYAATIGEVVPGWLTADLVARVAARLRQLEGHWRATPFAAVMELRFEVPAARTP